MIILDTSLWIEFFRVREPFFSPVARLLEARQVLGLPWIFGELFQGARDKREIDILEKTWRALPKPDLQISESSWIAAGIASNRGKWHARGIGLIDAAIVAAAEKLNTPVATLDKKLGPVLRFQKLLIKIE